MPGEPLLFKLYDTLGHQKAAENPATGQPDGVPGFNFVAHPSNPTTSTTEVAPLNNDLPVNMAANTPPKSPAYPPASAVEPSGSEPEAFSETDQSTGPESTGWAARDPKDIDLERFDPVWVSGEEFPGVLPEDLREIVGSGEFIQITGSLRTLFWIAGVDEAVDIIDDPTRKLEDSLEVVPFGTSIEGFLISRYVEEKLLPVSLEEKLLGFTYDTSGPPVPPTLNVFTATVPESVTRTATTTEIRTLYPWLRQRSLPQSVEVLKIAHQKEVVTWVKDAERDHGDLLARSGLLFRGTTLHGLEQCLSFFMPVISGSNHTDEFGPGIHVTPNLAYAKRYAGVAGAIMVFRHHDTRNLEVWKPEKDEWQLLVAHHLKLRHRSVVPPTFNTADVIIGPISQRLRMETEGDLKSTDELQHSYASYRACEKLSASLIGIIYIN